MSLRTPKITWYTTDMKNNFKIIIVIALVIMIMGIVFLTKNNQPAHINQQPEQPVVVQETKPEPIPQNQELCFSKNVNKDITTVTLTISGDTVTGKMDWVPFEKDSARGTLSGTLQNGEMNLLYDYTIEGAHQTEEKIMKIENGNLLIKHGELEDPKYNGNLIYKDKASAMYSEILEPCAK
jgi:methionine-rich copper-binding protein CopC